MHFEKIGDIDKNESVELCHNLTLVRIDNIFYLNFENNSVRVIN